MHWISRQPLPDVYRLKRIRKVVFSLHHLDTTLSYGLLLLLTLLLTGEAILSLQWRMVHDTPLLHYVAFLLDQYHYIPYKDIFETSMPGTFLFHLALVNMFGYGDFAFRLVDLAWLAALLIVTWRIMSNFSPRVAWAGVVLFGLSYFQYGPSMSLQRDYVAMLPIATAVLLAISGLPVRPVVQAGMIGLLFGLSATIKPHLAMGLPLLLLFLWRQRPDRSWRLLFELGGGGAAGLVAAPAATMFWLWSQGALPYFWEMSTRYLPLHLGLTRTHETISGLQRVRYLIDAHQDLGGRALWLVPASLGSYMSLTGSRLSKKQQQIMMLLIALTVAYSLYPVIAGQFFLYHWMPFQYFVVILSGLVFIRPPTAHSLIQRLFPIVILGVTLYVALDLPPGFTQQLRGAPPPAPKGGRVDEIALFLQSRLNEWDRVQPLDWTGGAVHAMLIAQAQNATPFIYDYHFYHHISHPFIQELRSRFLQQFQQAAPRFVIEIQTQKPWVTGPDTSREFVELEEILETEYSSVFAGNGYVIYERR